MLGVFEELDRSFPERRLLRKAIAAKSSLAFTQDIQPALIERFDFDDGRTNADAMDRVLALAFRATTQKHQTKGFATIDAAIDHKLVALFENMERNDDVRKQDEIRKGEKGYVHFTQRSSDEQFFILSCLIDGAAASSEEE